MTDISIRNVKVLDGTGSPAFDADIEIQDGRIKTVGTAGPAKLEIDGQGAHIAPGFIDTELTHKVLGEKGVKELTSLVPAKRLGHVDEIARFVLWLSSEDNTYVAGQNISIDGGFSRV